MTGAATLMRQDQGHVQGLLDLLAELPAGPLTMVEVGVYAGEATDLFLRSGKIERLYAVDTWQDFAQDGQPWVSPYPWSEVWMCFGAVFWQWRQRLVVLPIPSPESASHFSDDDLDLVYIDANHGYDAVRADILAWAPKVKAGGYLAGHDYAPATWPGVVRAVDELLGTLRVRHFADTSWMVEL